MNPRHADYDNMCYYFYFYLQYVTGCNMRCATKCAMYKSAAHTLLCSTQCLQHKLKPHITNLSYVCQLRAVIERYDRRRVQLEKSYV